MDRTIFLINYKWDSKQSKHTKRRTRWSVKDRRPVHCIGLMNSLWLFIEFSCHDVLYVWEFERVCHFNVATWTDSLNAWSISCACVMNMAQALGPSKAGHSKKLFITAYYYLKNCGAFVAPRCLSTIYERSHGHLLDHFARCWQMRGSKRWAESVSSTVNENDNRNKSVQRPISIQRHTPHPFLYKFIHITLQYIRNIM